MSNEAKRVIDKAMTDLPDWQGSCGWPGSLKEREFMVMVVKRALFFQVDGLQDPEFSGVEWRGLIDTVCQVLPRKLDNGQLSKGERAWVETKHHVARTSKVRSFKQMVKAQVALAKEYPCLIRLTLDFLREARRFLDLLVPDGEPFGPYRNFLVAMYAVPRTTEKSFGKVKFRHLL